MLKIENVVFAYGRRKPRVLDGFSLSLDRGGIYGLLGPNGVGKSTLLYMIMGMLRPKEGSITYDGTDTWRREPGILADTFLVPEEFSLPPVTLSRYIEVYGRMYPNFDLGVMQDCLKAFFMEDYAKRLNALSMGQKKKIFISFALACRTPLLLMDEPTNGLDIQAKTAFRTLMSRHIGDDRTVIISTHQVRDLEQLLDHIVIMNTRRVILSSDIAGIQDRLAFRRNVTEDEAEGALITIPSPGGMDIMTLNDGGDITDVNLELLFGYALSNPDETARIFNETSSNSEAK